MKKHLLILTINLCLAGSVFAQAKPVAPAAVVPTACIAEFKKVATETDKIFAEGVSKKTITPEEGSAYKTRDAALQKQFDNAVTDKKLTLADCTNFLKSANTEKAAITKLAAPK